MFVGIAALACAGAAAASEYDRRVNEVRRTHGFVALWDFVKKAGDRFDAWQPATSRADFRLDAVNYVRSWFNTGREATYSDFPLLGSGPFGNAVEFRSETDRDFRPCLLIPRDRLQNTALDVKGPGRPVSMVAWVKRAAGNHAIAGIWHEGTEAQRGQRQYALFAGLAANNGAVAAHVSENGAASFGDRYARNIAVTKQVMQPGEWVAAAFAYDNRRHTVTAYFNGEATEYWVDDPAKHPFFQWPARGWERGEYRPPEGRPKSKQVLSRSGTERVELHTFPYTKVRVTYRDGRIVKRELAALKVNPYWFPHDLYTPATAAEGGPFTIGRVIHQSRSVGFTGWIGGVAVFSTALPAKEMRRLASIRSPLAESPR